MIAAGSVLVSGTVAVRDARLVAPSEPIEVIGPSPRFVGRGGEKLDAALDRFDVQVVGANALDAGASTGGFVDCLLERGARSVIALDVGHGQLDARLRADRRVIVLERTNVRYVTAETLAGAGFEGGVDVLTADLSFISLTTVAPALVGPIVRSGGDLILLVKPQFEVGRVEVSRGKGVIRDPESWLSALRTVASSLEESGAVIIDVMRSPIQGASGNVEFFLHATKPELDRAPEPHGASELHAAPGSVDAPGNAVGRSRGVDSMLRSVVL